MRFFKLIFLFLASLAILFVSSCGNDDGERLSGQLRIITETSGPIDSEHRYLFTFSGLLGDFEFAGGVQLGTNADTLLIMPRVGERFSLYISNVPSNCTDISSDGTGITQAGFIEDPNDPDHPNAEYASVIIVPGDGSEGAVTFSITCAN